MGALISASVSSTIASQPLACLFVFGRCLPVPSSAARLCWVLAPASSLVSWFPHSYLSNPLCIARHPLPFWDAFLTLALPCSASMAPYCSKIKLKCSVLRALGRSAHVYPAVPSPTPAGQELCASATGHTGPSPRSPHCCHASGLQHKLSLCRDACPHRVGGIPTTQVNVCGGEIRGRELGSLECRERGGRWWGIASTLGHKQGSHPSWQPDPRA